MEEAPEELLAKYQLEFLEDGQEEFQEESGSYLWIKSMKVFVEE